MTPPRRDPRDDLARSAPRPSRPQKQPGPRRRRFELKEVCQGAGDYDAYLVYWDYAANGGKGDWTRDDATVFKVRAEAAHWGAIGERGTAELFTGATGEHWHVVENPGRPWYFATLNEALVAFATASATLKNGSDSVGTVTTYCLLLTSGQLDASSDVRVGFDPGLARWQVIGAAC